MLSSPHGSVIVGRVAVIFVHGTFANSIDTRSIEPILGSQLGLTSADIHQIRWPRRAILNLNNSHRAREEGSQILEAKIDELRQRYDQVFVIAHSHGGTVALMCERNLWKQGKPRMDGLVCVSTPFMWVDTPPKSLKRAVLGVVESVLAPLLGFLAFSVSDPPGTAAIKAFGLFVVTILFRLAYLRSGRDNLDDYNLRLPSSENVVLLGSAFDEANIWVYLWGFAFKFLRWMGTIDGCVWTAAFIFATINLMTLMPVGVLGFWNAFMLRAPLALAGVALARGIVNIVVKGVRPASTILGFAASLVLVLLLPLKTPDDVKFVITLVMTVAASPFYYLPILRIVTETLGASQIGTGLPFWVVLSNDIRVEKTTKSIDRYVGFSPLDGATMRHSRLLHWEPSQQYMASFLRQRLVEKPPMMMIPPVVR